MFAAGAAPGDVPADWLSRAQRDIAAREYHVMWQEKTCVDGLGAAWHATNRAQNVRTYFAPEGPLTVSRTDAAAGWRTGVALTHAGWKGAPTPVMQARLEAKDNTITYARGAALTEWYVNDEKGLKSWYRFEKLPAGGPPSVAELELRMAVTGNAKAVLLPDGSGVQFEGPSGAAVLRYGKLLTVDAAGRDLPCRYELRNEERDQVLSIVVDAAGARYPVTVDPLAESPANIIFGDQAEASFGFSISTAGDVNGDGYADVILGSPMYDNGQASEGRVCVYYGSAAGLGSSPSWTFEADVASARLGMCVGTAGDVNGDGYSDITFGSPFFDGAYTLCGRVYVCHGSAAGLTGAHWWLDGDIARAQLGYSGTFTAGDVNGDGYSDLITGSYRYGSNVAPYTGHVRVYHGSASGLSVTPNWSQTRPGITTTYGYVATTAGDVNADGYSDVVVTDDQAREAFVYHGSATGLSATHNWQFTFASGYGLFGRSAATAGDVNGDGFSDLLISAPDYPSSQGQVYVFCGAATGLPASATTTLSRGVDLEMFGSSVATAGDVNGDGFCDVVVGVPGYDNGQTDEGCAFLYLGSASGVGTTPVWSYESNQAASGFGYGVACAGDVNGDSYADVIVSARAYDTAITNAGAFFLFRGYNAGLSSNASWTAELNQASANVGSSVACAGDVNGDGYSDVILGVPNYDNGQADEGAAFVYTGTTGHLQPVHAWKAESNQAGAMFGWSVNTAGDVNGDGYSDIVVGAPMWDNGQTNEGGVFVWFGGAADGCLGPESTPAGAGWYGESNQAGGQLGVSVSTAGDTNRDGCADIIVGASHYESGGQTDEGCAFVWRGTTSGLGSNGHPGNAYWSVQGDQGNGHFGACVATAGDVNGDGFSDILVGMPDYDGALSGIGLVTCHHGSLTGPDTGANWTMLGTTTGMRFGASVSTAGDVNRDGYSDIVVGAPDFTNGETQEGKVFVFHGQAAGLSTLAAFEREGGSATMQYGASVSTAGDINRDGYSDIVVGAPGFDGGTPDQGRMYTYPGSSSGIGSTGGRVESGGQSEAYMGECVSTAGDVNGDGFSDVIVGVPGYENGQTDEGAALVYHGGQNEGGTALMLPKLRRADDTAPIVPPGWNNSAEHIRIGLMGITPASEGWVKLQAEFKAVGQAFDGSGLVESPSWINASSTHFRYVTQTFYGLTDQTNYHWRVRARYRPGTCFFQQASAWFHLPKYSSVHSFRTPAHVGLVKYSDNVFPANDTDPVGGQAYGWTKFGVSLNNPATTLLDYTITAGAYRVRVMTASASKYKLAGWCGNRSEWLPYKSVGTESYVRGKFYIYAQNDPTTPWTSHANDVPSFEMRVANRFAVTSQLFIDPGPGAAGDLRPSTDPAKPSVYRVDFDPVDVPFLATSTTNEGILPGFEVFEPVNNMARGTVAMTELALYQYRATQLGSVIQQKVYDGTRNSQAGDLHLFVPSDQQIANFAPGAGVDDVASVEYTNLPTYNESINGVIIGSAVVPSNRVGRISNDFHAGSDGQAAYTTRLRVAPDTMYKARFHITSTRNTSVQSSLWLKMRTVGSGYVNYLQFGPGTIGGNNGAILRQALPGVGTLNPESGWYTLVMCTPMSLDMRPDVTGTIAERMPALSAEPGPGVDAPSKRDVKVGFDFWDSIGGNGAEVGHFVIDRVEVSSYTMVADN